MNRELRVLILEDSPEDAELMNRELSRAGLRFRSKTVLTRDEFLRQINEATPDVILSDHGLPSFSGFAALEIVKKEHPEIPFLFVTGAVSDETAIEAFERGADDYILKSKIGKLGRSVRRFAENAEQRRIGHEHEEQLRLILESARDFAILTQDLNGKVTTWNSGAVNLFRYTPEEIIGRDGRIIFTPEDLAAGHAEIEQKEAMAQGRYPDERWHVRKNGERFWGSGLMMPFIDSKGQPSGFLKILRDDTEKVRMQRALQESEEIYRSMVETVQDYSICLLDIEGRVSTWNVGAERIEGYEASEIIGQHFSIFFTDEDVAKGVPARELHRALTTGRSTAEGHVVRKDRSLYWSHWTLTPIRTNRQGLHGFCRIAHDVTKRKTVEDELLRLQAELEQRVRRRTAQLEASNKELEAFSYSISHDLRAPLRHITAYAEILDSEAKHELPSESHLYLEKILVSAKNMAQLIDDLLAFSRIGRSQLNSSRVNLHDLAEAAMNEVLDEYKDRNVEWVISELPAVEGDPAMLRQVFINLLSNGLKYTAIRERAKIEVGSIGNEQEVICFVRDNGVGFDMHFAHKLFGVFQRLHTDSQFPGTGIGLAIVRRVIHRHGGRVWAEGALGDGATFYISLPKQLEKQEDGQGVIPNTGLHI